MLWENVLCWITFDVLLNDYLPKRHYITMKDVIYTSEILQRKFNFFYKK